MRGWKSGGKLVTAGPGGLFDHRENFVGVLNTLPKQLYFISERYTYLKICNKFLKADTRNEALGKRGKISHSLLHCVTLGKHFNTLWIYTNYYKSQFIKI